MKRFVFTIGDGMNPRKDWSCEWSVVPSEEEFRATVVIVLCLDPEAEALIEGAEIDRDETSAEMVINEGPNGECAPNGGPWLVAAVREVKP